MHRCSSTSGGLTPTSMGARAWLAHVAARPLALMLRARLLWRRRRWRWWRRWRFFRRLLGRRRLRRLWRSRLGGLVWWWRLLRRRLLRRWLLLWRWRLFRWRCRRRLCDRESRCESEQAKREERWSYDAHGNPFSSRPQVIGAHLHVCKQETGVPLKRAERSVMVPTKRSRRSDSQRPLCITIER